MVGGVDLWYNPIPYPLGMCHTNWRIIILQKFSHRSESSELHVRLPSLGIWHQEGGSQSIWPWKSCSQPFPAFKGLRELDSTLGGHTQGVKCTRFQDKKL